MRTLIGVLAHDRPEGLAACLEGVARAGSEVRVVIHLDDADLESRAIAYASGHDVMGTDHQIGIGASLNRILATREPGEAFCRIDGDTEIETEGWLGLMLPGLQKWSTLGTVLRQWDGTYTRNGLGPGDHVMVARLGRGIGSVILAPPDVMERLGGFREGFPYGFEDTDWYARIRGAYGAKRRAGTDRRIVAREAAPRSRKFWRDTGTRADADYREAQRGLFDDPKPVWRPIATSAVEIPQAM